MSEKEGQRLYNIRKWGRYQDTRRRPFYTTIIGLIIRILELLEQFLEAS